jgi:membrane protein HdeD
MPILSMVLRFAGIVSLVCGVLTILNPLAATLAAVTLAAAALVLSGGIQLVGAFSETPHI